MTTRKWREVLELSTTTELRIDVVKKAYRKKALHAHPDKSNDNALFLEIQQAYEKAIAEFEIANSDVLPAPVPAAAPPASSVRPPAPPPPTKPPAATPPPTKAPAAKPPARPPASFTPEASNAPIGISIVVSLAEVYTGGTHVLEFDRCTLCTRCFKSGSEPPRCVVCNGSGLTPHFSLSGRCVVCSGTGFTGQCDECGKQRWLMKPAKVRFTFPARFDFRKCTVQRDIGHESLVNGEIRRGTATIFITVRKESGYVLEATTGALFVIRHLSLAESLQNVFFTVALPDNRTVKVWTLEVIEDRTLYAVPDMGLVAGSFLYIYVKVVLPTRADLIASGGLITLEPSGTPPEGTEDCRVPRSIWPKWITALVGQMKQRTF